MRIDIRLICIVVTLLSIYYTASAGLLDLHDRIRASRINTPVSPPLIKMQSNYPSPATEQKAAPADEELDIYIQKYCKSHNGRVYYPIQHGIRVDCLTTNTMWKIVYAGDWQAALTTAMHYNIYDNYIGEESQRPVAGVVLILWDKGDFVHQNEIKRMIDYYNLPIRIDSIRYQY